MQTTIIIKDGSARIELVPETAGENAALAMIAEMPHVEISTRAEKPDYAYMGRSFQYDALIIRASPPIPCGVEDPAD